MAESHPGTVAFVLKGYPRLSETFIAQEIRALEQAGLKIAIWSLRHPTDAKRHPIHSEIAAPVTYLPEYLYREPLRVWRAWRSVRRRPGYRLARRTWLADLRRDMTPNRVRRFGQALVLAKECPESIAHLHAHFMHTPASVARYAAVLGDRSWSVSAHAKDVWTIPTWEKREKLADCAWLVTCTQANFDHLSELAPPGRVHLAYHGIDFSRFPPPVQSGEPTSDQTVLLSVGRAVDKKGYDDLLDALAQLPAGLNWRFEHIGGGPMRAKLAARAERLGLEDRINWLGSRSQTEVLSHMQNADIFVLPSRVSNDGDRDGLPNVLMEAMSQALPCIASDVSGIPELLNDGCNGLLVPQRKPERLARALEALITDPDLAERLGREGQATVCRRFDYRTCLEPLLQLFGLANPGLRQSG